MHFNDTEILLMFQKDWAKIKHVKIRYVSLINM